MSSSSHIVSLKTPPTTRFPSLNLSLKPPTTIYPSSPARHETIFLSNIDQTLAFTVETVHFFAPNPGFSPSLVSSILKTSLSRLLVFYPFMAGRLRFNQDNRLELDSNSAGAIFSEAFCDLNLSDVGDLTYPDPIFRQLFHRPENLVIEDLPLCQIQLTTFKCGGFSIGLGTNHTTLDGIGASTFIKNLASLASGEGLKAEPYNNRRLLSSRNPANIQFEHPELVVLDGIQTGANGFRRCTPNPAPQEAPEGLPEKLGFKLFRLSAEDIDLLKKVAMQGERDRNGGGAHNCTSFEVVTAHLWRCRAIATSLSKTPDDLDISSNGVDLDSFSMVLFAVDIRKRVKPPLPTGYCGNAVLAGYGRARVRELRERGLGFSVSKVREGVERMDDEYVRSVIDWGEIHKGVPGGKGSFFVSSWWKLGFEEAEYPWGKALYSGPSVHRRGDAVLLLPDTVSRRNGGKEGVNIFLALPPFQMDKFQELLLGGLSKSMWNGNA